MATNESSALTRWESLRAPVPGPLAIFRGSGPGEGGALRSINLSQPSGQLHQRRVRDKVLGL